MACSPARRCALGGGCALGGSGAWPGPAQASCGDARWRESARRAAGQGAGSAQRPLRASGACGAQLLPASCSTTPAAPWRCWLPPERRMRGRRRADASCAAPRRCRAASSRRAPRSSPCTRARARLGALPCTDSLQACDGTADWPLRAPGRMLAASEPQRSTTVRHKPKIKQQSGERAPRAAGGPGPPAARPAARHRGPPAPRRAPPTPQPPRPPAGAACAARPACVESVARPGGARAAAVLRTAAGPAARPSAVAARPGRRAARAGAQRRPRRRRRPGPRRLSPAAPRPAPHALGACVCTSRAPGAPRAAPHRRRGSAPRDRRSGARCTARAAWRPAAPWPRPRARTAPSAPRRRGTATGWPRSASHAVRPRPARLGAQPRRARRCPARPRRPARPRGAPPAARAPA